MLKLSELLQNGIDQEEKEITIRVIQQMQSNAVKEIEKLDRLSKKK